MGMGGGPDSAPGGSSSSSGTGNAPDQGMGAGAFDGGGGASKDTSTIEGFREAIARAMGVTAVTEQEAVSQEQTEAELDAIANARAIGAAVEARNRTQREAREQQEREALMDDIDAMQNKTNFATPAPAVTAVDLDTYDAKFATPHNMVDETETEKEYGPTFSGMTSPFGIDESQLDDPSNTDPALDPEKESFRAEEEARMGPTLDTIDREPGKGIISSTLDDDPWGGTMDEKEHKAHALAFVNEAQKEYDRIMKETKPFSHERNKALRQLNAIKNTDIYSKAYHLTNPSAVRNMIAKALGYLGLKGTFGIMTALENKAIERGLFDRTTFDQMMKEFDDPGAFGAAGNPLGTGGSDSTDKQKKIIMELFYQTNPWAKGLNQRQVDYYLDRPSELEWVRNLYNQMNPS